jgi:hypothetical protein
MLLTCAILCSSKIFCSALDIWSIMLLTYALLSCCHMLYYAAVICPIMLMSYGLLCCWYMLCNTAFQWKMLLSMRRKCSNWWHHKYVRYQQRSRVCARPCNICLGLNNQYIKQNYMIVMPGRTHVFSLCTGKKKNWLKNEFCKCG